MKVRVKNLQPQDVVVRKLESGEYVVDRPINLMKRRRSQKPKLGDKHIVLVLNEEVRQKTEQYGSNHNCPIATAFKQQVELPNHADVSVAGWAPNNDWGIRVTIPYGRLVYALDSKERGGCRYVETAMNEERNVKIPITLLTN